MELVDISDVLTAWLVAGPWKLSPLEGGSAVHQTLRVDAANSQSYVLRLSPDPTRLPFIQYEATILQALSEKGLPFHLPLPLKTKHGEVVALVKQQTEKPVCATLSPFLPGSVPEYDLPNALGAGLALAQLDEALADVSSIPQPDGVVFSPPFGEFTLCHPLVPDPFAAVDQLLPDQKQANGVKDLLTTMMKKLPSLYRELPQQLVHRDCGPANILMDNHLVTAILDFEFLGKDLRVLDLCVALNWWAVRYTNTEMFWDVTDALGTTYTRYLPLEKEELLAIPDVWLLRVIDMFVSSMGHCLAKPNSGIDIQERARRLLWTDTWLSAHRETFLSHVLAWK
jgi:homoserine kinase type II